MKKIYWVTLGASTLALLIGTFADLSVAEALFNRDSLFGKFFALVAMIPIWTLVPMSAGLMFGALLTQFANLSKLWRGICTGLLVFGIYAAYERTAGFYGSRHLHGLPFEALVYIVIATFLLSAALGAFAARRKPQAVFAAAIVGIVAVGGGRLFLDCLKDTWGRQRFWTMDDVSAQFTAWYQPQFPDAGRIAKMGDKIKSFPSGHSFGGMSMLWLSMFPAFFDLSPVKEKKCTDAIVVFVLCFWVLVMTSRLVLGEHFLSDVSMSAIIFIVAFMASNIVVDRFHPTL